MNSFQERLAKVRELARQKGLEQIVIRKNPNLAWLIGGRVHVPLTLDLACLDLIVQDQRVFAVTNAIEAPRLIAEELPSEIEVIAINWWEGRDGKLPVGDQVGTDQPGNGRVDLSVEIEILRQSLVHEDVERFKKICSDAAIALGSAVKECSNTDLEIDVAAKIASALWQRNLELVFIGVAGAERVRKFRHPLPTDSVVGNRVVASICARRKGLIASVTRIVTFADDDIASYENILKVEAEILDKTVVGAKFSEPIEAAIAAYPKFGFASDEWQHHHQGGPTGYAPRDWPANRESARLIQENQPIAWNPTGNGWKVEDTILAKSGGLQILSIDSDWPMIEISGRLRPGLLRK
jgi:Xaa-Pro aminopeptidase